MAPTTKEEPVGHSGWKVARRIVKSLVSLHLNRIDNPLIHTKVQNQNGFVLEARLDMHNENEFVGAINFYQANTQIKLDPIQIPRVDLEELAQLYNQFIHEDLRKSPHKILGKKRHFIEREFLATINTVKIKQDIESLLSRLFTHTILTIDGFNVKGFAKTLIQHHFSQFSTIIAPEYADDSRKAILLKIHICNVHAVNMLLKWRTDKIISDGHSAIFIVTAASSAAWIVFNICLLISQDISILSSLILINYPNSFSSSTNNTTNFLFFMIYILDLLGIPTLLLWSLPKVLRHIIQYQLNRYFLQEPEEERNVGAPGIQTSAFF